jgi:hypothetical protein
VLDARSAVVAPALRANGAQPPDDVLDELCSSHVNRLLRAAHDVQELVLDDLLDRVYGRLLATRDAGR